MRESAPENESPEHRLKRLRLRSWRRGTREMDLILGPFADARIAALQGDEIQAYECLICENDNDLYTWVTGRMETPPEHVEIISLIRAFHDIR